MSSRTEGGLYDALVIFPMNRIRVRMLRTRDQLAKGEWYLLPQSMVRDLIAQGYVAEPSEIKPIVPMENKVIEPESRKRRKRA